MLMSRKLRYSCPDEEAVLAPPKVQKKVRCVLSSLLRHSPRGPGSSFSKGPSAGGGHPAGQLSPDPARCASTLARAEAAAESQLP
jgi:hypothetical protein